MEILCTHDVRCSFHRMREEDQVSVSYRFDWKRLQSRAEYGPNSTGINTVVLMGSTRRAVWEGVAPGGAHR